MSLSSLLKKGGLRQSATAIPATFATAGPLALSKVAEVATVAVANPPMRSANDPAPTTGEAIAVDDFDRWCWPNSMAMTGAEIDTFIARLACFATKRVTQTNAQSLADRLVNRDREDDERRTCLECSHLEGYSGRWRCANWQEAQLALIAREAALPRDIVPLLQRCGGFTEHHQTRTNK